MHHNNPLAPGAVTDGYVYRHDIGGPLLAEPIAGNTCAVEALQWTHEPHLTLETLGRRVLRCDHPCSRRFELAHVRECTSIDLYVRSYSFMQVERCLLWPHGIG